MKKEKVQSKHTVIHTKENEDIEKILELHKSDRVKSRILIKNDPNRYSYYEEVLFENGPEDFHVISHTKNIKISSNNRMYFVSTNRIVFLYKKKKFWYIDNRTKIIRPMSIMHLTMQVGHERIYKIFLKRFPWIKFLKEHQNKFSTIGFNTIIKYDLFGYKECLKYLYKSNLPTAKLYSEVSPKDFQYYSKNSINIDKTNPEFFDAQSQLSSLFKDSIRMADILGEKVNCLWSVKRLTQEHDAWARKITEITMVESDRPLNIKQVYLDFAQWSGHQIITTTKELAYEGIRRSHCVGSYSNNIDSGSCAIFSIEEYTAQISFNGYMSLTQFNGFKNKQAPNELYSKIQKQVEEYNKLNNYTKPKQIRYRSNDWLGDNLPRHLTFKTAEGWSIEMNYFSLKSNTLEKFILNGKKSEQECRAALYEFMEENELIPKQEELQVYHHAGFVNEAHYANNDDLF